MPEFRDTRLWNTGPGEVCGLKRRNDAQLLAGDTNWQCCKHMGLVMSEKVWSRYWTTFIEITGCWTWQPSLLASGGGRNDATITTSGVVWRVPVSMVFEYPHNLRPSSGPYTRKMGTNLSWFMSSRVWNASQKFMTPMIHMYYSAILVLPLMSSVP